MLNKYLHIHTKCDIFEALHAREYFVPTFTRSLKLSLIPRSYLFSCKTLNKLVYFFNFLIYKMIAPTSQGCWGIIWDNVYVLP